MRNRIFVVLFAILLVLSACGQESVSTWQDYYDLGVRYLSEGNYEEAIIAFTAAIEIDPKQADAYEGRGDAYVGLASTLTDEAEIAAQYANAEADYLTAIELNGESAELYTKLETVYIALGDTDAAVAILEQGYAATGDESLKTEADSLSAASEAGTDDDLAEEDQTAEAEETAPEESEPEPTWQDYYDLGSAYLDAGDYEAAIEAFTEAISLDPGHAEAYVGRGNAYVAMAEALDPETQADEIAELYAKAEADYLKALELDDSLTEVYTKLADLYVKMESIDSATEILAQGYSRTGDETLDDYRYNIMSNAVNASVSYTGSGLDLTIYLTIPGLPSEVYTEIDGDTEYEVHWDAGFCVSLSNGQRALEASYYITKEQIGYEPIPSAEYSNVELWNKKKGGGGPTPDGEYSINASIDSETITYYVVLPDGFFSVEEIQYIMIFYYYYISEEERVDERVVYEISNGEQIYIGNGSEIWDSYCEDQDTTE